MSNYVVIKVPIEEVTPRDIVDDKGNPDKIVANIKSIQKVSDHRGGIAEYYIHTRSRKRYRYYPGALVNIRIKLTDLLKDL